jgi:hypothetical protein
MSGDHVKCPEQGYGSSGGTSIPTQRDIAINGVVSTDSESGAYSIFEGFDADHPLQIALENTDLANVTQDGNHGNESPQAGESGDYPERPDLAHNQGFAFRI